jgi:hypothetical protein
MMVLLVIVIAFIELISLLCVLATHNQESAIYPFLNDPAMAGWTDIVSTGTLAFLVAISIFGILLSFLLGLGYFLKFRFATKRSAFSIVLAILIALSIIKILFLSYNLHGLLKISSSIRQCDDRAPHIKCANVK